MLCLSIKLPLTGAFGWAEKTTNNPSLYQPGAIHHLLWLQYWGEAGAWKK